MAQFSWNTSGILSSTNERWMDNRRNMLLILGSYENGRQNIVHSSPTAHNTRRTIYILFRWFICSHDINPSVILMEHSHTYIGVMVFLCSGRAYICFHLSNKPWRQNDDKAITVCPLQTHSLNKKWKEMSTIYESVRKRFVSVDFEYIIFNTSNANVHKRHCSNNPERIDN